MPSYKAYLNNISKNEIALFIALLFHVSGCIGMFTSYKQWFIDRTPLNLWIVFFLILYTQKNKNSAFYLFLFVCFVTGMLTEMVGVNSGWLFGDYTYGTKLGPKMYKVPFLIGTNWFVVMYCSGVIINYVNQYIQARYQQGEPKKINASWQAASIIIDGALLATFFDWVMEPVAVKFSFWTWGADGSIPLYNYACWFVISCALMACFRVLRFDKENLFAVHLFCIQVLFFSVLRTFL